MRLEVSDAGDGQVNVVAPASDHRVRLHTDMVLTLEV